MYASSSETSPVRLILQQPSALGLTDSAPLTGLHTLVLFDSRAWRSKRHARR